MALCVTDSYRPSASPTLPPSASHVVISHIFFPFCFSFFQPILCGFCYTGTAHHSCSSCAGGCPTLAPASHGAGQGAVSWQPVTAVGKAFWKAKPTTGPRHCSALEGDHFSPVTRKTLSVSCQLWAANVSQNEMPWGTCGQRLSSTYPGIVSIQLCI